MGSSRKNSDVAEDAANALAPCDVVVVLSINKLEENFETRIFGRNARQRLMADTLSDVVLAALAATDPPCDMDFERKFKAALREDAGDTAG